MSTWRELIEFEYKRERRIHGPVISALLVARNVLRG